jgi:DNA-binding beta-propeller fold protein YncE
LAAEHSMWRFTVSQTTPTGVAARRNWLASVITALVFAGRAASAEPTTLELMQTIPLQGGAGRYDHLAVDGRGGRLFIANLSNNTFDVVDLKAGKLIKQIPDQRKIQGIAYVSDLDRIFVGNGADGVCNVFDGRDYRLLHTIKLPDADNVRYDSRTRQVYVIHAEKALTAIDPKTFAVRATIKLPGAPEGFQIDPTRPRLYINTLRPARVSVIDTEKNQLVGTYSLTLASANYPLTLDPTGRRVFVGCRQPPMVVALNADTGKEVTSFAIPGDTDDIFFDAQRNRLYAICGEGFVAVALRKSAGRFGVVEKIATIGLARTGLFDPESGRLYVVLPRQSESVGPSLRVYQAKS